MGSMITGESILVLILIAFGAMWLILDQVARALKRGRAIETLRQDLDRLVDEMEERTSNEGDHEEAAPLRTAA